MKRIATLRILASALALCLFLSLPSLCTGCVWNFSGNPPGNTEAPASLPDDNWAVNVYETMLDHLYSAPDVTIRTEMEYEVTLSGNMNYRASYSATEVFSDPWEDTMLILCDASATTEYKSGGLQTCSTSSDAVYGYEYRYRRGFANGYMFREYVNEYAKDRVSVANKTPVSAADYGEMVDHTYEDNFVAYLNYGDSATADRRKLEDGSWEIRFGGLCQEDLNDMDVLYGPDFTCISEYVYIVGADLTVVATPDFRFDSARIELEYAEYDEDGYFLRSFPAVVYELVFEETAAVTADDIPLDTYTDAGDLRIPRLFTEGLNARGSAESVRYTYENGEHWVTGGEESFFNEEQNIRYDLTVGGELVYGMEGRFETPEESWILTESYKNGVLTYKDTNELTGEVEESHYDYTPEQLLWDLFYFIWPPEYNELNVERIECLNEKEGTYRLHIGLLQRRAYEEAFAAEGDVLTDFTVYVDLTLRDGMVIQYAYHMETAVQTAEGSVDTYCQELSWVFEKKQSLRP